MHRRRHTFVASALQHTMIGRSVDRPPPAPNHIGVQKKGGTCCSGASSAMGERRSRRENTAPHAHKKGVRETAVGHTSPLTRSILAEANPRFWSWAIQHAAFIWSHSHRKGRDILPPIIRAGLCPPDLCRRILDKYSKNEFGAEVLVLKPKWCQETPIQHQVSAGRREVPLL